MSPTLPLLMLVTLCILPRYCQSNQNTTNTTTEANKTIVNIAIIVSNIPDLDDNGYYRALNLARSLIESNPKFKYFNDRYKLMLTKENDFNVEYFTIKKTHDLVFNTNKPKPLAFIGPMTAEHVHYAAITLDLFKWLFVTVVQKMESTENRAILSSSTGIDQELKARMKLLQKFKWKRVAIVYSLSRNYYIKYIDKMVDEFSDERNKINLIGRAGIEVRRSALSNHLDVLRTKLQEFEKNDTKIFIAEIGPYDALILFCEVFKLDMYGEDIVWIISSNAELLDKWVSFNKSAHQIVTCSKEDLQKVINGSFIFKRELIRNDNTQTDCDLTPEKYMDKIVSMWNISSPRNYSTKRADLRQSALAFDAFWAIVTALNNSIDILDAKNYSMSMADTGDIKKLRFIQETLTKQMRKVDFQGMAGPYSYSGDSINKDGTVILMHYEDNGKKLVRVGQFDTKTDNLTFINDPSLLWGAGGVPLDRSIIVKQTMSIDRGLFIAITTLATIGIFLGIMFLTFNLVYGKYKFIKLSAPLFNNIIACGCILCLISVFLFGVHDVNNPEFAFALVCKARAWTLTMGFSCAFGAMFVKTWRIYKICTNKKLRMKLGPLSNWYLLSLIGAIIFIDLIILVTWELVDPLKHGEEVVVAKDPDSKVRFKYYKKVLNVCKAEHMVVWLAIFYVYKGILILYGLFLAYETRNVIYAHLNDSRVIGICVYNVVVLSVVGAFLSLLLEAKNYKEMYIVLAVCITFPAVATISLMMFPKLHCTATCRVKNKSFPNLVHVSHSAIFLTQVAYRCKTDNLDDTETIANGMTTFDVSTMHTPQIHVTTHVPQSDTPQPSCSKDAKFAYHNKELTDSNAGSEVSQNGDVKQ